MSHDLPALDPTSRTWLPLDEARRLLIDTYPGIAFGLDTDGRIAWVNPATVQRLGHAPADLLGQPFAGTLVDQRELDQQAAWRAEALGREVAADFTVLGLGLPDASAASHPQAASPAPREGVGPNQELAPSQAWVLHDKDGLLRPTRLAVGALRNGHGEAVGWVAVEPWPRAEGDVQPQFVHHDHLTGLPSRAVLPDRTEMALQRAARQKSVMALLLVELSGFEALCSVHGRSVGDDLLRATAGRLYFELRKTDTAVRLQGGRFAALLIDLHAPDEALQVGRKIRRALSTPANVGVARLPIDARVGIAWYPDHGDQLLPLMEAAERALARATAGDAESDGVASAPARATG